MNAHWCKVKDYNKPEFTEWLVTKQTARLHYGLEVEIDQTSERRESINYSY